MPDSGRQATMNNDAYGVIYQPFREVCDAARPYDSTEAAKASTSRGTDA
jgi:hypothetical protein